MRLPRCVLGLASLFLLIAAPARAHAPTTDMLEAANKFLAALSPEQKSKATYPLTDAERENWNFVPTARHGLPFKEMTPAQHDLSLALLRTGLGQRGFARAEAIMSMELVLKELENGAARRDPTNYFTTIFGTPAANQSWGWRFEGHHVAFNFTVIDGSHVFFTPSFIGANPAEVPAGPRKGERVLGEEEDLGHALVNSLDAAQRQLAVFDTSAPGEIFTTNQPRVGPLSPAGIAIAQLQPGQRANLLELVKLYLARFRTELMDDEFAKITAAGLDKITFAWAGSLTRGAGAYYRIQGPTFLIEFDNTQNGANHIHTAFRDFKGDFGRDLLAEHYAAEHTPAETRIEATREAYSSWSADVQTAVLKGNVSPGMTPEMVRMAVGKPTEIVTPSGDSAEIWIYGKNASSKSGEGENRVIFRKGVVERSDFPKR